MAVFEMFKQYSCVRTHRLCSPFWKVLRFIGLPKDKAVEDFKGLRWICKSPVLQKWFLRSVRPRVRQKMLPSAIHSYGFREKTGAGDLTGLIRQMLYHARLWKLPLLIGCQDMQAVFDSMPHEGIKSSLLARGVPAHDVGLYVEQLSGMKATIHLPGVGETGDFTFSCGGKQGGIETPDEWRALVEHVMDPLVRSWSVAGYGFSLGDGQILVSHAVWFDNIFLFVNSLPVMQQMVRDLDVAFGQLRHSNGARYLRWKPSSLEVLKGGSLRDVGLDQLTVEQDGDTLEYEVKPLLRLLGDMLDGEGSNVASMNHNLGKADIQYYKHRQTLRNRSLPLSKRLKAWTMSVSSVVEHCAATWHVTDKILHQVRSWELKMLRRLLGLYRRPSEGQADYNKQTADKITHWMTSCSMSFLYCRVLRAVFKAAWKEVVFTLDSGAALLREIRNYCRALWWTTLQSVSSRAKRRKLNVQHGAPGRPAAGWENPFVCAWGLHWQSVRDSCRNLAEWMVKWKDFCRSLEAKWELKLLPDHVLETGTAHCEIGRCHANTVAKSKGKRVGFK